METWDQELSFGTNIYGIEFIVDGVMYHWTKLGHVLWRSLWLRWYHYKVYAVSYSAWQSDFFLQSPAIGEPGSAGQAPPLADSGEAGRHSASQTVWHK